MCQLRYLLQVASLLEDTTLLAKHLCAQIHSAPGKNPIFGVYLAANAARKTPIQLSHALLVNSQSTA